MKGHEAEFQVPKRKEREEYCIEEAFIQLRFTKPGR